MALTFNDQELTQLERYQLEMLVTGMGYEPDCDDTDADLVLVAHNKMHELQINNWTSEGRS